MESSVETDFHEELVEGTSCEQFGATDHAQPIAEPRPHASLESSATHLRNLAEQIRDGDRSAFEALFRGFVLPLCDFAERHVHVRALAEEIVQDVFMTIWMKRATWQPRNVRSYLYGAVRNRALDHVRHRQVVQKWQEEAPRDEARMSSDLAGDREDEELSRAVRHAVNSLPERSRIVFLLSREHDLSYREIASALDISVKTVESNMRRAFQHLREALAPFVANAAVVALQFLV